MTVLTPELSSLEPSGSADSSLSEAASLDPKVSAMYVQKVQEILNHQRCTYTADQVSQAARSLVLTGKFQSSIQGAGINFNTARHWKKQVWWDQIIELARADVQKELDSEFTSLIHKSVHEIQDRLENGNPMLAKNGSVIKVPVQAEKLIQILSVLFDKRALLRGEPTSRIEKISTEQRLRKLAKRFGDLPKLGKDIIQDAAQEELQDFEEVFH